MGVPLHFVVETLVARVDTEVEGVSFIHIGFAGDILVVARFHRGGSYELGSVVGFVYADPDAVFGAGHGTVVGQAVAQFCKARDADRTLVRGLPHSH